MSASASTRDSSVGEEFLQGDLDTARGADASSLDPKATEILPLAVVATQEVVAAGDPPTASRMPGYSEKPVTQKRSSHACLIIKIMT
jgi:hypothetical protein